MTGLRDFTRAQWLALSPQLYLADGYLNEDGGLRGDFLADYATAAATQLRAAKLSPQEFALTAEGIRQILPLNEGTASRRLHAAIAESLLVVARAIRQPNNRGMVQWLDACAAAVTTSQEMDAFLAHLQAVVRRYGVLAALSPDSSGALPQ